MTAGARLLCLGAAILPYFTLASWDAWMHGRARQVPHSEKILHALAALTLLGFLTGAFLGATTVASIFLGGFVVCSACDEIGFHRGLAARERRIHFAAYAALGLFFVMWRWVEGRA